MADEEREEHYIWRHFPIQPVFRWACTIIGDSKAASGFRILDSDPIVADAMFLTRLDQTMREPHQGRETRYRKDGIYDYIVVVNPGDEHFIEIALHSLQIDGIAHSGKPPAR